MHVADLPGRVQPVLQAPHLPRPKPAAEAVVHGVVLVLGGSHREVEDVVGAKEVIEWGGKVVINPIVEGFSTTSIINKLNK